MEARHALSVWLITLHSATALTAGPGILLNLYVPKLAPQPRTPPLSRTPTAVINRWNLALDRVVEEEKTGDRCRGVPGYTHMV